MERNTKKRMYINIKPSHFAAAAAAAAAKLLQSCPTLCDPMDCSLPGFSVHGILQARTLEWAAISFSNAWKWKVKEKSLSRVWLLATSWTAAYQAPPPMRFSGNNTGVGCHCLLPYWHYTHSKMCTCRRKLKKKKDRLFESNLTTTKTQQLWKNAPCLVLYDLPLSLAKARLCIRNPLGLAFSFITQL